MSGLSGVASCDSTGGDATPTRESSEVIDRGRKSPSYPTRTRRVTTHHNDRMMNRQGDGGEVGHHPISSNGICSNRTKAGLNLMRRRSWLMGDCAGDCLELQHIGANHCCTLRRGQVEISEKANARTCNYVDTSNSERSAPMRDETLRISQKLPTIGMQRKAVLG